MMSAKQQITIIFCCVFLLVKPTHALIPVFDWMESVPLFSQLTTTTKSLNNIKSQLTQLKSTLTSIGDKVNTISKFTKDISKINDNLAHITNLTSQATKAVDDVSNIGGSVQDKVDDAINDVTEKQNDLTNQIVSQVNDKIEQKGATLKDKFLSNKKGELQLLRKEDIKKATIEEVEEEEEEEEINDVDEDILEMFAMIKEESRHLTEELNDILEDAIYILNESTDLSHKQLTALQEALIATDLAVDKNEKENIQKKLAALIIREEKASDWGADIIESAKNRYNREYQEKLVDGINNYEKVIKAYLEGNATKEEVKQTADNLKKEVASINVVPDDNAVKSYKEERLAIKKEMTELASDIEKMLADKKTDNL